MTDREIDALVAEKVLGQTWDENRCRICGWPIYEFPIDGCTIDDCSLRPLPKKRKDEPAHFTTDARACALIKAELRRRGCHYDIGYDPVGADYTVEIVGCCEKYGYACEATEERALCVAALRAVGVEG